ncbi:MAG: hypothetical protein FJ265_06700 [Planctomycetes bacterium]|nr:hypothetical protein [Planctomycetota bacterium]
MRFLGDPEPMPAAPPRERRLWVLVLLASALATAVATRWPWVRVKFERLFQAHLGPPGWQSTVGFTCLSTSLFVAVMALVETTSPGSKHAVRPGSLMLCCIALAMLGFAVLEGPGDLGGVSAAWTPWFYVACVGLPVLCLVCLRRWAGVRSLPR